MTECEQTIRAIMDALDTGGAEPNLERLREHLAQCRRCRALWAQYHMLESELARAAVKSAQPPPSLHEGIMRRLDGERIPSRRPARRRWTRVSLVAATLAVILMVTIHLRLERREDRQRAEAAAIMKTLTPPAMLAIDGRLLDPAMIVSDSDRDLASLGRAFGSTLISMARAGEGAVTSEKKQHKERSPSEIF